MKGLNSLHVHQYLTRTIVIPICSVFISAYSVYAQEKEKTHVYIANLTPKKDNILKYEDGWRRFLNQRLEYNVSHRFTTPILVDIFRESEMTRLLASEIGAKHMNRAVEKAVGQTFKEEILLRAKIDDYVEQKIIEPAADFLDGYLLNPLVKIITTPFKIFGKNPVHRPNLLSSADLLQDALRGNEKNQLVNPLNKEGIPGEEHQQPFRLPRRIALGARPLNNYPYGYATIKIGDWYTQLRLGAADILSRPRLNEASWLFQKTISQQDLVFSLGGVKPFENRREPENYFGPHAYVGLSKIINKSRGKSLGAYIEVRAGDNYNSFFGLNYQY